MTTGPAMEEGARRKMTDRGFACFLFCGLVSLIGSIPNVVAMDSASLAGFGLLIVIPLCMLAMIAMVSAVICSVRLRTHALLWILRALSLSFIIIMVTEAIHGSLYEALPVVYGAFAITLSLLWILVMRGRPSKRPTS